jgi:hypothetical protein
MLQQPQHVGPQACGLSLAAGDACPLDFCSSDAPLVGP